MTEKNVDLYAMHQHKQRVENEAVKFSPLSTSFPIAMASDVTVVTE